MSDDIKNEHKRREYVRVLSELKRLVKWDDLSTVIHTPIIHDDKITFDMIRNMINSGKLLSIVDEIEKMKIRDDRIRSKCRAKHQEAKEKRTREIEDYIKFVTRNGRVHRYEELHNVTKSELYNIVYEYYDEHIDMNTNAVYQKDELIELILKIEFG
jgi:hypothetical protein